MIWHIRSFVLELILWICLEKKVQRLEPFKKKSWFCKVFPKSEYAKIQKKFRDFYFIVRIEIIINSANSPNHDACVGVIVKNSPVLCTFWIPVNAGIMTVGNEKHNPKSSRSKFLAVVASVCKIEQKEKI